MNGTSVTITGLRKGVVGALTLNTQVRSLGRQAEIWLRKSEWKPSYFCKLGYAHFWKHDRSLVRSGFIGDMNHLLMNSDLVKKKHVKRSLKRRRFGIIATSTFCASIYINHLASFM